MSEILVKTAFSALWNILPLSLTSSLIKEIPRVFPELDVASYFWIWANEFGLFLVIVFALTIAPSGKILVLLTEVVFGLES